METIIPATRQSEPGPMCAYVRSLGFSIADVEPGVYTYDHTWFNAPSPRYASAEDCAVAALEALAQRLALEVGAVLVPRSELFAVKLNLMVSGIPGELDQASRKIAGWLS